jgi:hypothetical protein
MVIGHDEDDVWPPGGLFARLRESRLGRAETDQNKDKSLAHGLLVRVFVVEISLLPLFKPRFSVKRPEILPIEGTNENNLLLI